MVITKEEFGKVGDASVSLFKFKNKNGVEMHVTELGAIVTAIMVPNRDGKNGNCVLGFDNLAEYKEFHPYLGAIVGRCCNRVGGGSFELEGKKYTLATNDNGKNALHGGISGFDKKVWRGEIQSVTRGQKAGTQSVAFELVSPDGEEGYPGTMTIRAWYTLTDENEMVIDYEATTDKTTIINVSNHSYFNLKDGGSSDVLGHFLKLNSDSVTPYDATSNLIPTGGFLDVKGTPFDFAKFKTMGEQVEDKHELLQISSGYDINYVLKGDEKSLKVAATVYEPTSGRCMEIKTTEPGLHFYTGNFIHVMPGTTKEFKFGRRSACCLETQHFPDSPNKPQFPTVTLRPSETFQSKSVYKFSTEAVGFEKK
eukprot:Filipodium_phascolosomae@DN630_c0_g1_i1.p1